MSEDAVLWVGRPQVLALRMDGLAEEDGEWELRSTRPDLLEVQGPVQVLAGQSHGFVRLHPRKVGEVDLVLGDEVLRVRLSEPAVSAFMRRPEPRIVGPSQGACVTGHFSVGVELPPGCDDSEVLLEVGGHAAVQPARRIDPARGPEQRFVFEVDAGDFPAGPLSVRAVHEVNGETFASEALGLTVLHPGADDVLRFELEETLDLERAEAFGPRQPAAAGDPLAEGGACVVLRQYDPTCVVPVDIPAAGRWQAFARLRGDLGAGGFPTVSLTSGTPNNYVAAARILDRQWHRLPIGGPVEMEEGEALLGLRLANAVQEGRRERRDLYLDQFELVRVPDSEDGAGQGMSMMSMAAAGPGGEGLWVGFHQVFDGLPLNGSMLIEGIANWAGGASHPAPWVELWIDGAPVAGQQTPQPIFRIDRDELGAGEHSVQLRASQPGRGGAETPIQTLVVADGVARSMERAQRRFGAYDDRWELTFPGDTQPDSPVGALAEPRDPVRAVLDLPEDLTGPWVVSLDARGPEAPAVARVAARIENAERTLAKDSLEVRNWWNERRLGTVDLPPGPKRLVLDVEPAAGADTGQNRLQIRSVIFEREAGADRLPPVARVLYPKAGQSVFGFDAVVVEASDNDRLQAVELLVDGRPTGLFGRIPAGAGYVVIPLLTGDLDPGEHSLSVRAYDRTRNQGDSLERTVQVLSQAPDEAGPYRRALHLLNRLAYGPDPRELAEILVLGEEAWLEQGLQPDCPGDRAARELPQAINGASIPYNPGQLALKTALVTDQPLRSRFVFFVDNHFSTWSGKTGRPSEWGDHRRYQELGLAPFSELLAAAATSPILLMYLDQERSFAGRLNENFARELLELHTVGVDGGYTQGEVTALAGLLTGMTVSQEAPPNGSGLYQQRVFRFAPDLSAEDGADILGMRFENARGNAAFERVEHVLSHLAAHPSTARNWSTKLAEHYAGLPAAPELVDALVQDFHASGGDPRSMLRTLVEHPAFWDSMQDPRMTTPLDYALRLGRTTVPRHLQGELNSFLDSSGMGLFDHATPDGYPEEDEEWIDTNALLSRWRVAQRVPWAVRRLAPDEVRQDYGEGRGRWRQRAIDHVAFGLTGSPLGEDSNGAALRFLETLEGQELWRQVDQLAILVTRLPEANLR